MTLFNVKKSDVESFTLVTNPKRFFRSSSSVSEITPHGITGSMYLSSRRISSIKDVFDYAQTSSFFSENSFASIWKHIKSSLKTVTDIHDSMENYMTTVRSLSTSEIETLYVDIERFTPSYTFTEHTLRKLHIKDVLNKHYRIQYPTAHWAYTNYHSLNFFTSSKVPEDSVLLYPNENNRYNPSGAFTLFTKIKPAYKNEIDTHFKAGTIYHVSSSYALSLISGSLKDGDGKAQGFRLLLQLSHSADISPSEAINGVYPNDLIFMSDDNSLTFNNWHDVAVRWGTSAINSGTGSFVIDGVEKGTFVVPSSSILSTSVSGSTVLFVGNYYEGPNTESYYFSPDPALRDGLVELNPDNSFESPTGAVLAHPLNAELHELKISSKYYSNKEIMQASGSGLSEIPSDIVFYVPPFFTRESPIRRFVGTHGGIIATPFQEIDGETIDPYNVALSFDVGGHDINLENFVRDFASSNYPRLLNLTGSAYTTTTLVALSANELLYDSGSTQTEFRKRNLTILPCDDGKFRPNYFLLNSGSLYDLSKYVDDLGHQELSLINLDNLCSTGSIVFGTTFEKNGILQNNFLELMLGPSPETPGLPFGPKKLNFNAAINQKLISGDYNPEDSRAAPYTIYQRTLDPSSNEVVMFSVDDLFYGIKIRPGSLVMTDENLSGSGGKVAITLKDDGRGNIYRHNADTSPSPWNSVGNIYYDEGVILIKSPHLAFFGKDQFEMSFEGVQNVHVMTIDAVAPAGTLNSSSNSTYSEYLSASNYPNDPDKRFTYINSVNFHDDNYNVICRARLAQPIIKRVSDSISFRVKMDF